MGKKRSFNRKKKRWSDLEVEFGGVCVMLKTKNKEKGVGDVITGKIASDEIYAQVLCAGIAGRLQLAH